MEEYLFILGQGLKLAGYMILILLHIFGLFWLLKHIIIRVLILLSNRNLP